MSQRDARTSPRLRTWLPTSWSRQMDAVDDIDEEAAAEHLETLREQVIDRSRQLGMKLAVSSSGNKVAYSNGETFTFIPSRQAYVAAMQSRRVDIHRPYNKSAPTPRVTETAHGSLNG